MASHWVWLRNNNNNMMPMMWVPASSASCRPHSNSDATMPTTWAHVATPQRQQHDADHMGPHPLTPLGAKSEAVILSTHGPEPIPASPLQDHVSVSRDLGLLDLKVGAIITGSSWYYLLHKAASLKMALMNFSLSIALKHTFTPITTGTQTPSHPFPTPFPYTPSPYTPSPYTPSPYTPSPYTPSPYTPSPYTPSPYTPSPYTPSSYTSSPSTPF